MSQHRKTGFLSYAHEDRPYADRLHEDLTQRGIPLWYDQKDRDPEQNLDDQILSAIKESYFIVILLSSTSVAKEGYIRKEIRLALEMARCLKPSGFFIIPARIEECEPRSEELLGLRASIDLFPDWENGIDSIDQLVPVEGDETDLDKLSPHDVQANLSNLAYIERRAIELHSRESLSLFIRNHLLRLGSVDKPLISRKITNISENVGDFAACIQLHHQHDCGERDPKTKCNKCSAVGSIVHGHIDIGGKSQSDYNDNYVVWCQECFWCDYDFEVDYLGTGPRKFDYKRNTYD